MFSSMDWGESDCNIAIGTRGHNSLACLYIVVSVGLPLHLVLDNFVGTAEVLQQRDILFSRGTRGGEESEY